MATGASTADAAVLLVDVRDEVLAFARPLGFATLDILPGSALRGDMVVARGPELDWFEGPTLLERLESLDSAADQAAAGALRFPVQLVSRPQGDSARSYLGRIESGTVSVGDEVLVLPGARRTRARSDARLARRRSDACERALPGAPGRPPYACAHQGSREPPRRAYAGRASDRRLDRHERHCAREARAAVAALRRLIRRRARHGLVHPDRRGYQPHRRRWHGAMSGTVYLVGAGPGAADLLTLRAARLLGEAEIVFHDALVPGEILSLARRAQLVAVGKRSGRHSTAQRFINKRLADAARKHRVVVRLKGGDPLVFGRAQEEIDFLRARGIVVEVVPGITAALAAGADLGVSLTQRGVARSLAFVTPRVGAGESPSTWVQSVLAADTAAIYMGAGEAPAIAQALMAAGKAPGTPVVVIENASMEHRAVHGTLAQLAVLLAQLSGGPVLILLGEVLRNAARAARSATARRRLDRKST